MMFLKQIAWLLVGVGIVLAGAVGYSIIAGMQKPASKAGNNHSASASAANPESARVTVKTVFPKLDTVFVRAVTAPAYVEAFYKADLFAHVAGPVKYIEKNIGDPVKAGELLVEID